MNNKRNWIILAVILLLLIGLGAYVFAGSGEELLNSGNGNSSETENSGNTTNTENTLDEEEEEESNTNTETNTNTGGTNTNTLTVTAVDTSYDDAEAAVSKAESTLTQDDVDSATALIVAVTTGTDTSSLTERLEAVQSLIDLTNLVNTLKSYVDDATSLSDITDARTYESTNTIISLVESLDASDTKTSLTNIINSISSILEDETSPVISVSTLNSESYASSAITVTVTEDNDYTIYLGGVETTLSELSSLTDGTYTIKVVDASYNEQSVTFTIDTVSPVITVASSTGANNVYSTVELNLTDTDSLASVSINGEVTDISGTSLTITFDNSYDDGDYEVILTDVAGNTETYSFTLDNTIPEIEVASNKYTVGGLSSSNSYSKLSVKTTDNYSLAGLYINDTLVKTITGVTNSTYNKIEEYFASYLNEGEENTIYVIDQAGNKSNVITFVYDTTAASIAYTSYKTSDSDTASNTLSYWTDTLRISMASNEKLGQSATVTITDSEGTEFVYTASLEFDLVNSGGQYIYTTTYDLPDGIAEGEVTITISDVYDLAGNETEAFNYKYYEKTIIVDTTAGTATISTSNYFINSSRVSIDVTIDEENIDSVYYTFSGYADEDSLIANKKSDEWVSQTYLDSSNSFTITWDITGSTYLWIKIVDKAGNVGYVRSDKFVLDTESPVIYANDSETISNYYNEDVTIKVTDDNIELPIKVEYTDVDNNTSTKEYDTDEFELEEDGTYSITATDKAGNTSTVTFVIDKTAPEATISFGVVGSTSKYATVGDLVRVTLSFDEELATLPTVVLNGTTYTAKLATSNNGTYTYQAQIKVSESTTNGKVTLTASGYADAVGNVGTTYTEEDFDEIIVDTVAPVINNLTYGRWYDSDVTIDIDEENIDTITLDVYSVINGVQEFIETKEVSNGDVISGEYKYVLTVTDKVGYTATVQFGIDATNPTITLNGTEYNETSSEIIYFNEDVTVNIQDNTLYDYSVTLDGVNQNWSSETTYSEEGTYVVTAKDKHGSVVTVTFEIDKTSPVVTLYKYEKEYTGRTELAFDGYYSYSLAVSIEDDNSYTAVLTDASGKEYTFTEMAEIGSRANYTLTVTDVAGNVTVAEFAIDKDKPQITGVSDGDITNENVTAVATDTNLDTVVLYKNDELVNGYENGSEISEEGTYIITATDKAGNSTSVTFTIDKTAASRKSTNYYTRSGGSIGNLYYARVGSTIVLNMRVDEELGTMPTFTLYDEAGNSVELTNVTLYDETSSGQYYRYEATYTVSENTELTDGEITLVISNIVDKAGNKTEDITASTNGNTVVLDTKAPSTKYVYIYNMSNSNSTSLVNGDKVRVVLQFNEELAVNPTITVGNQSIVASLSISGNTYSYYADFAL